MRRPAILVAVAHAALGCTPTVDLEVEREALIQTAEAYHEAASSKDVDAVVGFYADDAVMIPPNGDLVEGIDQVRTYRFGFIETPGVQLDFQIVRVEVAANADIAWTFALGDITIERPDGPPGKDLVRDFHTWRRQPDGSWRIVVDMWNSGIAPDA